MFPGDFGPMDFGDGGGVAIAVDNQGHVFVAANGQLTVFLLQGNNLQRIAQAPYAYFEEPREPEAVMDVVQPANE